MAGEDDSPSEEMVRKAVDQSQSGAPAAGSAVRDRFSAGEIFQRVVAAAAEEVNLGLRELFFSGLAAGFAIEMLSNLERAIETKTGRRNSRRFSRRKKCVSTIGLRRTL